MKTDSYIQTERLSLSPLAWTDLLFFFRLAGNSDVRRFLGGPVPLAQRLSRFKAYYRGHPSVGIWMVKVKATRKSIGLIELTPHKDGVDYEVSYQFHPSSWGCGFASEATSCVVNHAITDLGLEKILAETQTANERSCRLLDGLGFIEIRTVKRFGAQQAIYSKT